MQAGSSRAAPADWAAPGGLRHLQQQPHSGGSGGGGITVPDQLLAPPPQQQQQQQRGHVVPVILAVAPGSPALAINASSGRVIDASAVNTTRCIRFAAGGSDAGSDGSLQPAVAQAVLSSKQPQLDLSACAGSVTVVAVSSETLTVQASPALLHWRQWARTVWQRLAVTCGGSAAAWLQTPCAAVVFNGRHPTHRVFLLRCRSRSMRWWAACPRERWL